MIGHILLIDNYDSFTYNLSQYFQQLGARVTVRRNDEITAEEAGGLNPDYLVISPGPGTADNPKDVGQCENLIESFRGKIPVLGVCLGHQLIGKMLGGRIEKVRPQHGKRWEMAITQQSELLQGFETTFQAMRYHSMIVARESLPANISVTAETADHDRFVMAFEKPSEKLYGVQFHPESIGTPQGLSILKNFLTL